MKTHNGSIYAYKGQTVRLRQKVGAVCTLRAENGSLFLGRTDLLKRVGQKRVETFVAKVRLAKKS